MVVIGLSSPETAKPSIMMVVATHDPGNCNVLLVGDSINMKLLAKILFIPLIIISFCIRGCETVDRYTFCVKNETSEIIRYKTEGNVDETIEIGQEFCGDLLSPTIVKPGDSVGTETIENTSGTVLQELKTADEKNAAFVDVGNNTFRWTIN